MHLYFYHWQHCVGVSWQVMNSLTLHNLIKQLIWKFVSLYCCFCFCVKLGQIISMYKTYYRIRHRIIIYLEAWRQYTKNDQHTQDTWVLLIALPQADMSFLDDSFFIAVWLSCWPRTRVDKLVCHSHTVLSHQDATWLSKFSVPSFLCSRSETRCWKGLWC